jgi:hypothetical protein
VIAFTEKISLKSKLFLSLSFIVISIMVSYLLYTIFYTEISPSAAWGLVFISLNYFLLCCLFSTKNHINNSESRLIEATGDE